MAAKKGEHVIVEAAGREVRVSNPGKVFFPEAGVTKLDLVNYYLECEEAVVRGLRERPTVLKRWVDGVEGESVLPEARPRQRAGVAADGDRHVPERAPRARARRRTTPRISSGASTSA